MTRVLVALLLLALPLAADVGARASVRPQQGARVGEPIVYSIELRTPKWFTRGPQLPELDIPGAVVRRLSSFGINGTTDFEGEQHTTQTWEYTIYPQRAGAFQLPALDVQVFSAGKETTVKSEPIGFSVQPLPESVALAAQAFSATQKFEFPDSPVVGDAVTRTITLRSEGAPGMLLPPIGEAASEGMAAYPKPPTVDDAINRGTVAGTRVEVVTYVFEQPGRHSLPEVRIPWWNIAEQRVETAVLPEQTFDVGGSVAPSPAPPPQPEETDWSGIGILLALAGGLALVAVALRRRLTPERLAFVALLRAQSAHDTYIALGGWLAQAGLQPDSELRHQVDVLGDHLYGDGRAWDRKALRASAIALRSRARQDSNKDSAALPPLNPTASRGPIPE